MGLFNPVDNSINLKLVYYGPAFGGKTTNLRQLQQLLDPDHEQGLISVNTGQDSTLFFDYLPLRFRLLDRYQVRIQGYTVPGQVRFDTTRRLVLKGADGVIFVADSSRERHRDNRASLQNLFRSLRGLGMDAHRLPVILQYNKRDMPGARSLEDLQPDLNRPGRPHLVSTAVVGEGVLETFQTLLRKVVVGVHAEYDLERRGLGLGETLAALDRSLDSALDQAAVRPALDRKARRNTVRVELDCSGEGTELAEALLEGAVSASVELAELAGSLAESRSQLSDRLEQIREQTQRTVHDLRKPLVALTNTLYLLAEVKVPPAGAPALELATEVVRHMGDLLDQCAAELKGGDAAHAPDRVVDLNDLAEGVLRRLSSLAHGHCVELSQTAELPRLRGSPEEWTSLLSNLLGNAIKYCHDGASRRFVELTGQRTRRGYLLAVRDNGVGVLPRDRQRIFSKYVRAERTAGVPGTGLGLHIAREIAHAHGGRLGLRSRPGGGSLFYVLLPEARLISPSAVEASGSPRRCRPRVPEPFAGFPSSRES